MTSPPLPVVTNDISKSRRNAATGGMPVAGTGTGTGAGAGESTWDLSGEHSPVELPEIGPFAHTSSHNLHL